MTFLWLQFRWFVLRWRRLYSCRWRTLVLGVWVLSAPALAQTTAPDWSSYNALLAAHVQAAEHRGMAVTLVDYAALGRDPLLAQALQQLQQTDLQTLDSREQRLAFYINAYNLLVLKLVSEHWPVTSVRQIGTLFQPVWSRKVGRIGGRAVSLGDIEHRILRPMNEPRVHFALAGSALSGPDLRLQAYTAADLDAQLEAQTRAFLHNPHKGVSLQGRKLRLSPLFSWFARDFAGAGGVQGFINRYRPLPPSAVRGADLYFDWGLNQQVRAPAAVAPAP